MHTKFLGGENGTYKNNGSCKALVEYLEHEDREILMEGREINHFFSLTSNNISSEEVEKMIDNNKAKLCKDDDKFFSIVVSPSEKEIQTMGKSKAEQIENFREFIKDEVMQRYAENFNKNLNNSDIMFYAKIHEDRSKKSTEKDLHCHIIVSRKTIDNKLKISPLTNHKNTTKGSIKGGFNRKDFQNNVEKAFDKKFSYKRDFEETFEYKDAMKNGNFERKNEAVKKAAQIKFQNIEPQNNKEEKQEIKQSQQIKKVRTFKR